MDYNLKNWITSALLSGYKVGQLHGTLLRIGFSGKEVEKELALCAPYIEAISKMGEKLHRREALMKTLDHRLRSSCGYLKTEKVRLPPYRQFLEQYYYPNRFGLFDHAIDTCEARHWTPRSLVGKVGVDTLVEMQYGRETAGGRQEQNTEKHKKKIKFGDYINMMEESDAGNEFYMTGANYHANNAAFKVLQKDLADVGDGYLVPEEPSIRMDFFIGPKGTVTQAHHDVVNVLFIQIYGRKRIRLVPAMQTPYMYDNVDNKYSDVDLLDPKPGIYPEFAKATVIEVEVGPGDCLFIPIGWWHHVMSLTASISVACTNIKTIDGYANIMTDFPKAYDM